MHRTFRLIVSLLYLSAGLWSTQASALSYTGAAISPYPGLLDYSTHTAVSWIGGSAGAAGCRAGTYIAGDNDMSAELVLPFSWSYGVNTYSKLRIHSNARVAFNNNRYCGTYSVGTTTALNRTLMPGNNLDLNPGSASCSAASCYVRYGSGGTAPNRYFAVTWVNVPLKTDTSKRYTVQIVVNEDGTFEYRYGALAVSVTAAWQRLRSGPLDYESGPTQVANTARRYSPPPPPAPLAYYTLDESNYSGSGSLADSLGSNHATPNGVSPTAGGGGYYCRGTTVPTNTTSSSNAIQTPLNLGSNATLKSAGTISFWWKPSASGSGMVFDASASNKYFYMSKRTSGGKELLYFVMTDSKTPTAGNNPINPTTVPISIGAWHHIAIAWSFPSGTVDMYLDGSLIGTRALTTTRTINSSVTTLYFGDNRNALTGALSTWYNNSAAGVFDEIRVYGAKLSAQHVANDFATATHACTSVFHHLRIQHDGSASPCAVEPIRLIACADAACTVPYHTGGDVTLIMTASGAGNTWTPGTTGSATSTLTIVGSSGGYRDVTLAHTSAGAVTFSAAGYSSSPLATAECYSTATGGVVSCTNTISYTDIFSFDIADHIAGEPQTVSMLTCDSSFSGATKSVKLWHTRLDPTVTGPAPGVVAGGLGNADCATGYTSLGTTASPSAVNLAFSSASKPTTQFTVCHADAGKLRLNASYDAVSPAITGNDIFITRPYRFEFSATGNPAAVDASGGKYVAAGSPFTATITARNKVGAATPSFGMEASPEGVNLISAVLVPSGGDNGLLSCNGILGSCSVNGASFSSGVASLSDFSWDEVGIMQVVPSLTSGNYLGSGGAVLPPSPYDRSGNIGRFFPHHYQVEDASGMLQARSAYGGCYAASVAEMNDLASGSTILPVADAGNFSIGDRIVVAGAGSAGGDLRTTVSSVDTTANTLALATAASTTVSDATIFPVKGVSYMGETIDFSFRMKALNANEGVTKNMIADFSKFSTVAAYVASTAASGWGLWGVAESAYGAGACRVSFASSSPYASTKSVGCPTVPTAASTSSARFAGSGTPDVVWDSGVQAGVATFTGSLLFNLPLSPDGPYDWMSIAVKPTDSDGSTLATPDLDIDTDATVGNDRVRIGVASLRQGRLKLANAIGFAPLPLMVPTELQTFTGTGWTKNSSDSCSLFDAPTLVANPGTLGTSVTCNGGSCSTATATSGTLGLALGAPTPAGSSGYFDITWPVPDYLRFRWNSSTATDPTARATFGLYSNRSKTVFKRERY